MVHSTGMLFCKKLLFIMGDGSLSILDIIRLIITENIECGIEIFYFSLFIFKTEF